MKKFDENLSKKAKKMSLEECHAPTISSVIFIYAHAMVYINLQSLLKFQSIFSVCL